MWACLCLCVSASLLSIVCTVVHRGASVCLIGKYLSTVHVLIISPSSSRYQKICPTKRGNCVNANESDVRNMSSTQGWTCGNLVTTVDQVALYFWTLLGLDGGGLLSPAMLKGEMLKFESCVYFGGKNDTCTRNSGGEGWQTSFGCVSVFFLSFPSFHPFLSFIHYHYTITSFPP